MISLTDRILQGLDLDFVRRRKPAWIRARLPGGPGYERLRTIMDEHRLHTVCESAKCPNMGQCWSQGTATIMILGDVCTRSCGFCHVKTGRPTQLDTDEPARVARSVALMGLQHIVITSVNRDELADGGAVIWAETVRRIREASPGTAVEVLIPDFAGDWDALQLVLDEKPDVVNHNMETVRRLYPAVRPQAKYDRSIELLRRAKQQGLVAKTGIMVGIGETDDEVVALMHDVIAGTSVRRPKVTTDHSSDAGVSTHPHEKVKVGEDADTANALRTSEGWCDILTIGQYLQPTRNHLPVSRWVEPGQFIEFKRLGESIGFGHVESGPMVRSSYHAHDQVLYLKR